MMEFDDLNPPPHSDEDAPFDPIPATLRIVSQLLEPGPEPPPTAELNLRVPNLGDILNGHQADETPEWLAPPDGPALFYPGRYHDLHGLPSGGKTWTALAVCAEVLNTGAGGIVWIDWEDTPATFVRRLQALGVPDVLIGDPTLVRYVQPQGPLHAEELAALLEHARSCDAAMIVLDALAPALALDGLDENSNTDVTRWVERVVKPFLADGRAVTGLDHIPKDPDNRSIGGRGAGAKRAIIDGASYTVLTVTPFSRNKPGEIKLKIAKDRPGMVGPVGSIAAHIRISPHDNGARLDLTVTTPVTTTDERGQFVPTFLMEKVSRHFETLPDGTELSKRMVCDAVKGKHQHLRTAVDRLYELGHIESDMSGTNPVYTFLEPYRETDETDTELARVPRVPTASPASRGRGANPDTWARVPASPGNYKPGTRDAPHPDAENQGASSSPQPEPDPHFDHDEGEPW